MSEAIAKQEANHQEVVAQKRKTWADMGEMVYRREMELQAMASQSVNKLFIPQRFEEVPEAEALLKELKADQKKTEGSRKEITQKFDDLCQRLMVPEKSFTEPVTKLTNAIIGLKRIEEERLKAEREKADEIAKITQFLISDRARMDGHMQGIINKKIQQAYEYALEKVEPKRLAEYLKEVKQAQKPDEFRHKTPMYQLKRVLYTEYADLVAKHHYWNAEVLLLNFRNQLDQRFANYEVEYLDKEAALELARAEEQAKAEAIRQETEQRELAARLAAAATDVQVDQVVATKSLKKAYEVDMPETVESVLKIMAAFSANLKPCLDTLRVNKWFAFTPKQAAAALAKLKSEDNNFQCQGIIFKEVDKL